jgi:hypothetical protein
VKGFREAAKCSERHACGQLEVFAGDDAQPSPPGRYEEANERLRVRLREQTEERRRWGYRRLHILLEREGWEVNSMRVYSPSSLCSFKGPHDCTPLPMVDSKATLERL